MFNEADVFREVTGLYKITPLNIFRRTPGIYFDNIPTKAFPHIDAIDRVIHVSNGVSPGSVDSVSRPWYMHTHQDDNLIVLHGTRYIDLYTKKNGSIELFVVSADFIKKDGIVIFEGAAMLSWPRGVFHRVRSLEEGSAAINFAVHHKGIDIKTNFNIYDLDPETGKFRVLREGYLDQP